MVHKKPKPEPDPIHKSAHPLKRRRPIRTFSKKDLRQISGRTVQDRAGYFWIHVSTAESELEKQHLETLLKKDKKEYKFVRNGNVYEFFIKKEY